MKKSETDENLVFCKTCGRPEIKTHLAVREDVYTLNSKRCYVFCIHCIFSEIKTLKKLVKQKEPTTPKKTKEKQNVHSDT